MDWLGFGLILLGNWLIGSKKKVGFIFIMAGSFIWVGIALSIQNYALAALNFSGALFMLRGWLVWRREGRYWNSMKLPEYQNKWWQIWK